MTLVLCCDNFGLVGWEYETAGPGGLWQELAGRPINDSVFADFMATWAGSAIYEVWDTVGSLAFTRFLSGEAGGAESVRFEWELLDEDLRHLLPFASNDHGGVYFLHSRDGSIWYGNFLGWEDDDGGKIADTFTEFLDMICLDDDGSVDV